MSENLFFCPICKYPISKAKVDVSGKDIYKINCLLCGDFKITGEAWKHFHEHDYSQNIRSNISGWILENDKELIRTNDIKYLVELKKLSVAEKAIKLLITLEKYFPNPGQEILNLNNDIKKLSDHKDNVYYDGPYPFSESVKLAFSIFTYSRAINISEFLYLMFTYLTESHGYLIKHLQYSYTISPKGWEFLEKLKSANPQSTTGFIAMRFDKKLLDYSKQWVFDGIREAGYEPYRVDRDEHNDFINDKIMAGIRSAKFMVADYTENSYGVYYEAGFAKGLNIPVINICEKKTFEDPKKKPHFDVDHLNFILWEWDKGEKLKDALRYRIEHTIGKGIIR